ncbi:uncharacterized protein LOC130676722 [Microplitis mediator]|uniref:uncharacterized protein LOC130676722 n=1 Tax=Microplitis mediator TaxID=375433 RepID=UPI0025533D63|nr:uncharacterized protein LOC130676722 [Microplitis mediator]
MSKSITWCLISYLFKNNHKTGIYRFIKNYNTTNVYNYPRKLKSSIRDRKLYMPQRIFTTTEINNQIAESKRYDQHDDEFGMSYAKAVLTLVKTLDVTRDNASKVVRKWKGFTKLPRTTITKNYQLLRVADVDKSTLRIHMYALAHTTDDLIKKISFIEKIKLDINAGVPLLQLSMKKLIALSYTTESDRIVNPEFNNRIEYMAKNFECSIEEMCTILLRNKFMLTMSMYRIKKITKLLLDGGFLGRNIKNDLHVYKHGIGTIKERMERVKHAGVKLLKPWIVRCPLEMLERVEEKYIDRNNFNGPHEQIYHYINLYFNCDKELIDAFIKRNPRLLKINIKNLVKILKFLRSKEYQFEEIYRQPSILHHKEETLRKRFDKLIQCHVNHPPLRMILSPKFTSQINLNENVESHD